MEESETTEGKQNSRPWLFKKGQSGNPKGRPKGQSVKERAKTLLASMNDDEFEEFLAGMDKKIIWEMAEGKAKQDVELSGSLTISEVLNKLENGQEATEQGLEDKPSI